MTMVKKPMRHLDIPIWNKCNNNCIMCTNTQAMRSNSVFSYDSVVRDLENRLKAADVRNCVSVGLNGGETTMHPDFFRLLDYIKKRLPYSRLGILTNGRMFSYEDFCKKLFSYRGIDIRIPLHSHDPATHDRITRAIKSFEQTTIGLKYLLSKKPEDWNIEVRVIINRLNYKNIGATLDFINKKFRDVDIIAVIFPEFEGFGKNNKRLYGLTYKDVKSALSQISGFSDNFKNLRLYHFPLCCLVKSLWPHAWKTLPKNEVLFFKKCSSCFVKKYCVGIHKSYLNFNPRPEIHALLPKDGETILETDNPYNPIRSLKFDSALSKYKKRALLTEFLLERSTEPTKYFFSSLFFKLNKSCPCNANDIRRWWSAFAEKNKRSYGSCPINLYVHIPFCRSRCNYCMYQSTPGVNRFSITRYLNSIYKEMSFYKDTFRGKNFSNIYIGGGCPSILDRDQLADLLTHLSRNFTFSGTGERNFECNPESIDDVKLDILKKYGFNRISIGVQSLEPKVLKNTHRAYQPYEIIEQAVVAARSRGLKINVDLMAGLYQDSPSTIISSFKDVLRLNVDTICLYPLKPTGPYLKKYFKNNEKYFYRTLAKKIKDVSGLLNELAKKNDYTHQKSILLTEGYCVDYSRRKSSQKTTTRYYDNRPASILGIGAYSVSKIAGIGRYNNISDINGRFTPDALIYHGLPSSLKDDMRDYILEHFAKRLPISQKNFKSLFNQELLKTFPDAFWALKKLKKIEFRKNKIYFLPMEFKEVFAHGLLFWEDEELRPLFLNTR